MYVIYKSSRVPRNISYSGPTWDLAGLRPEYREVYSERKIAQKLAEALSLVNPVGFKVAKVKNS